MPVPIPDHIVPCGGTVTVQGATKPINCVVLFDHGDLHGLGGQVPPGGVTVTIHPDALADALQRSNGA